MGKAYYNENDQKAAAWLRELIKAGAIASGDVDERSIEDVQPNDLRDYTQCHFFAGIGGWSYALRLAGWPDGRPVWTGSCPCQPFSTVGKGRGFTDERHLWPAFYHLIELCRPRIMFGEQVANKDGLAWLDVVQTDLESSGYAFAAADICAAGVGAPHARQRLYFVGDSGCKRARGNPGALSSEKEKCCSERKLDGDCGIGVEPAGSNGYWSKADWIDFTDGKSRPVEPGTFPLADGIPGDMGRMRGYGNAIVPQVAAVFIQGAIA